MVAMERALRGEESERMARDWKRTEVFVPWRLRRSSSSSRGGGDGGRDGDEGDAREAPYGTVEELLSAPFEDVRRFWEGLDG